MSHRSRVQAPQGVCYGARRLRTADILDLHPPGRCCTLSLPYAAHTIDSLPEWSKGVDSSSTSASCVGSNPTAVILTLSRGVFAQVVEKDNNPHLDYRTKRLLLLAKSRCFSALSFVSIQRAQKASSAEKRMSSPGVEPGLSRPRRDVLTTRRWGLLTRISA